MKQALSVRADFLPVERRASTMATHANNAAIRPVDHRGSDLIPIFRDDLILRRAGIRILDGLAGSSKVQIPKALDAAAAGWVPEDGDAPSVSLTWGLAELEPHSVACQTVLSRRLVLTSNPSADQLVRADLSEAMRHAVDAAFFTGAGGVSAEPLGIVNYPENSGINIVSVGVPTRADLVTMRQAPRLKNASNGGVWVFSPLVESILLGTELAATAGDPEPVFLLDLPSGPGQLLGDRYFASGIMPDDLGAGENESLLVYGDFSEAVLGLWLGVTLTVDPYTQAANGGLRLVCFQDCDILIRRPQAFAIAKDVVPSVV